MNNLDDDSVLVLVVCLLLFVCCSLFGVVVVSLMFLLFIMLLIIRQHVTESNPKSTSVLLKFGQITIHLTASRRKKIHKHYFELSPN